MRRPAEPPAALGEDLAPTLFGTYAGTTIAGNERAHVTRRKLRAHDEPSALRVHPEGLVLRRRGRADVFVAAADLQDVLLDGDVVVVTWRLGEKLLDSRFALDTGADGESWVRAATSLTPNLSTEGGESPEARRQVRDVPAPMSTAAPAPAPALVGRAVRPAYLALEDGRVFRGEAFGAPGESFGEAVFNTGMTGYQETLTDPSYHRQVVVMTSPQIGNTGMNDLDPESDRIWVAGFVVRDLSRVASNWRAQRGLDAELRTAGVVGVTGVDTRAVTRHLRDRGAMRCAVSSVADDTDALVQRVLDSPGMAGADLARDVSTLEPYVVPAVGERLFRVAALDLGMKRSIPAYLSRAGCEVYVLPANATADNVLACEPDGVFVSNGPGDPGVTDYAVDTLRDLLGRRPVFGICLGHQLLGRALGLDTMKLQFGHRGVNQPVQDLATGRVAITSHNHGFAVVAPPGAPAAAFESPAGRAVVSHTNLNDGVVEGLRCLDVPAFSVQYHPEAAAGPHDATGLFTAFTELMSAQAVPR